MKCLAIVVMYASSCVLLILSRSLIVYPFRLLETCNTVFVQRQQYFYSVLAIEDPRRLFKIDWWVPCKLVTLNSYSYFRLIRSIPVCRMFLNLSHIERKLIKWSSPQTAVAFGVSTLEVSSKVITAWWGTSRRWFSRPLCKGMLVWNYPWYLTDVIQCSFYVHRMWKCNVHLFLHSELSLIWFAVFSYQEHPPYSWNGMQKHPNTPQTSS